MPQFLWPDALVLLVAAFYAYGATRRGFVAVLASLVTFVGALLVAFTLYPHVADLLTRQFGWTLVWTRPIAFVALWAGTGLLLGVLERALMDRLSRSFHTSAPNRLLAIVPGAAQGVMAAAVILTLLSLLPLQTSIRRDIQASPIGGKLAATTLAVQRPFEGIFGPAAREALGLIPVRPPTRPGETSSESIKLPYTVGDAAADPATEEAMLALVNREREANNLPALEMDEALRLLARRYADDMFKRGFFSHDTPEGVDPFERMREANISFGLAGENLALAPSLETAHNGLMNSPGHRANILRDGFRKVGIGVMDGGVYGKMFVQEFTD